MEKNINTKTYKLALTALFTALSYISFTYLKIPILTLGGDKVAIHTGNAFCVLAAILLGGIPGGIAGSIGMTIADLMDPVFITSAPKTFVLKFCIGFIAGFIAHKIAKITREHNTAYVFKWTLMASVMSLGFNVVMDPILGYFYKKYVLGVEASAAKIMSTWAAGVTFINAILGTALVVFAYMLLRPVLKKAGLFIKVD